MINVFDYNFKSKNIYSKFIKQDKFYCVENKK